LRRFVLAVLLAGLVAATPVTAAPRPALSVSAATLVAPGSGQELYGLHPDARLAIASTTKLMTALVTLQHASMNEVFRDPDHRLASVDSQIGLVPGERMTVHDLFVAMLVPSADDAAYDLAYNLGHGSVASFVALMNADAQALGLTHTHYSTPIGLDTPGNYSSAADLVKLAFYLLRHYPLFAQVVALPSAVLRSGNHIRDVVNRNDLLARFRWIRGVKTGHTLEAGYVLVAAARREGLTLLSAVLGTASEAARDANTLTLLNWGFAHFRLARLVTYGAVLARPPVPDQPGLHADVIAGGTVTRVVPRGARITVVERVRRSLAGPLAAGTTVGHATALVDGQPVANVRLILGRPIPALSTFTKIARFVTRATTLLLLAALILSAAFLVARRRQQRRAQRTTA
jgi:D-alanyl-D-alanine carboxypeptidase (penicillin-binding protein 5/6)